MADISKKLVEAREQRGWSQAEFASKLGITQQRYHHYEHGRELKASMLMQICAILECSPNWLLGVKDEGMQLPPDSLLLRRLKEAFDTMNAKGQEEAVKRVEELCELDRYKKKSLDADGDPRSEVA